MEKQRCTYCRANRLIKFFHKNARSKTGIHTICKDCRRKFTREAGRTDRERMRTLGIRCTSVEFRLKALSILGEKCKRCGFEDMRALQIDHVFGGGLQEIKKMGCLAMYRRIIEDPRVRHRYQTLCANCNWIKRHENGEQGTRKYVAKNIKRLHRPGSLQQTIRRKWRLEKTSQRKLRGAMLLMHVLEAGFRGKARS